MRYPHLWARLYGAPLLIWPEKAKVIEEVFRAHILGTPAPRAMDDGYASETEEQRLARVQEERSRTYSGIALQDKPQKPYALTVSGVALVPVLGTLVQRGSWVDSMSGLTSYDSVASLVERAATDPEVRAILLEVDSPGGEAAGVMEMASRIQAAGRAKPVWASANEQAYSAAYWIASAAEKLYVPQTGGVGSIGAVALHVDQSRRDKAMGYTYTFVYAGAKKVDMNSHQPLTDRGRARLQAEVDRFYQLFTADVARFRGITAEAAQATEAGLLTPEEALVGKFVDGVATLRETLALLEGELSGINGTRGSAGRTSMENDAMKTQTDKGAAPEQQQAAEKKYTQAELDSARAEGKVEGAKEGEAKAGAGRAEGVKAERERVRAILASDEAKERQKLALHLALETDTEIDAAKKLLAASPKESGTSFAAAMANLGNPKVGADIDATAREQPKIDTQEIYAARRQAERRGAQ